MNFKRHTVKSTDSWINICQCSHQPDQDRESFQYPRNQPNSPCDSIFPISNIHTHWKKNSFPPNIWLYCSLLQFSWYSSPPSCCSFPDGLVIGALLQSSHFFLCRADPMLKQDKNSRHHTTGYQIFIFSKPTSPESLSNNSNICYLLSTCYMPSHRSTCRRMGTITSLISAIWEMLAHRTIQDSNDEAYSSFCRQGT